MADANSIVRRKDAAAHGLTTYYTGKPCKQGHIARRFVANGTCAQCLCSTSAAWKDRRDAYCKEYDARYKRENAAAIKAKKREYRAKNAEKVREYVRRYKAENAQRERIAIRRWRDGNIEHRRAYQRAWALANPERARSLRVASKARRRAREAMIGGDTPAAIARWIKMAPKVCHWCGKICANDYHVDHYEPLSRGGLHQLRNLVIACQRCNQRKSAKDPYDFALSLGRLF